MKIWQIITPENEVEIEVSNQTLLYGHKLFWNNLVHQIDEYFNSRNSPIKIYEGSLPVNKNDWKCYFIPFDAEVQLSKITASSPLKDVRDKITEKIMYSPLFQELLEIWEELGNELEIINQSFYNLGIQAKLSDFDRKSISNHIFFNSIIGRNLSPLEYKMLLIEIILEKPLEKRTLIIVELPEIYADEQAIKKFKTIVEKSIAKGYQFMFVSQLKDFGVRNYYYNGKVIHLAILEQIKNKIRHEVPFYCSEELYEQASDILLKLVDNSMNLDQLMQLEDENIGMIITIIHTIMYNLDMGLVPVPQGLEPNLKKFIHDLR